MPLEEGVQGDPAPDEAFERNPADKPAATGKTAGKSKAPGSKKAVETMFRNSYRAELDTIALAAMKANIMISLHNFIMSALMISGAFIFASSPAFLLPAGVFLVTAAASIIFALLSASPERGDLFAGLRDWDVDLRHREVRTRDVHEYMARAQHRAGADGRETC